jgi:hypothetical protein
MADGNGSGPSDATATAERMLRIGRWVIGIAAVLVACLIVGGYGMGWAWTGLSRAVTLWEWLQALLLPVALGLAPVLLLHHDRMRTGHRALLVALLAAFALLVAVGYLVPLPWTGFSGHTLWDWFELTLLPLTVTAAPVWVRAIGVRPRHLVVGGVGGTVFAAFVLAGYAVPLAWTGFVDNTAWDWVKLLLLPALIPTVVIPLLTSKVRESLVEEPHRAAPEAAAVERGITAP